MWVIKGTSISKAIARAAHQESRTSSARPLRPDRPTRHRLGAAPVQKLVAPTLHDEVGDLRHDTTAGKTQPNLLYIRSDLNLVL